MSPTETRISLPWPPSTNELYAIGGNHRRVVSPRYKAWKETAGWTLQAQRPPKFSGPVSITIELCPPHTRRFDLDNRTKSTLDLLVTHGVLPDDNSVHVRSLEINRVDNAAPCTVIIRSALL